MDDLHGDRAQEQALNTTETSRSHHDVLNAFITSYLGDRFRRLSGSDESLKADIGRFRFCYRVLESLGRCLRCFILPVVVPRTLCRASLLKTRSG